MLPRSTLERFPRLALERTTKYLADQRLDQILRSIVVVGEYFVRGKPACGPGPSSPPWHPYSSKALATTARCAQPMTRQTMQRAMSCTVLAHWPPCRWPTTNDPTPRPPPRPDSPARLESCGVLVTRASTRQHKKIVISGTIAAFRSGMRVADMAVLSPGTVMKSSGQRPPTENTVSCDTVLFPLHRLHVEMHMVCTAESNPCYCAAVVTAAKQQSQTHSITIYRLLSIS